jgi:hypothetical protein
MPQTFVQKVITKLQVYIEQCRENSEYIFGSNKSKITEKTIVALKTNRVIVSTSNEEKARSIIQHELRHQEQQMFKRIMDIINLP